MPAIKGTEIRNLIDLFNERRVKLYHACQLKDFKTYLYFKGIPSRNLMESERLPFTPFDTDAEDRNNNVWNKVFANLSDFGRGYAMGTKKETTAPVPNPYGPILFVLKAEVLNQVNDVAICLRSAGGRDFDREKESLSDANEVSRIFKYKLDEADEQWKKYALKNSEDLKREFHYSGTGTLNPEVSLTVKNESLIFGEHIEKIIVDKYAVNEITLIDEVKKHLRNNADKSFKRLAVYPREYKDEERINTLNELFKLLIERPISISDILGDRNISDSLKDWCRRIEKGKIGWQFNRYAKYLRIGTALELISDIQRERKLER